MKTPPSFDLLPAWLGASLGLFLFVVALFWFFLPITIWQQLKHVIRLLKQQGDTLDAIERNTRKPGAKPDSSVRYIAGLND